MSNEIAKVGPVLRPGAVRLVGLAAKKAAAAAAELAAKAERGEYIPPVLISPKDAEHKIGIVFDDSSSMDDQIANAHAGVEEFLRSCKPNQTAVSIYAMNSERFSLSTDLPALALLSKGITPSGSTPLYDTLIEMLTNVKLTRAILFSDGEPNGSDEGKEDTAIDLCNEKKTPCDTIFLGSGYAINSINRMKRLAEKTGGIFLHFDPAKSNFRTAFKYLSPGFRAMLADKSFVDKIQNGGV